MQTRRRNAFPPFPPSLPKQNVLPTAQRALARLHAGGRWRTPVVFMTNGGGMLEQQKAEQLAGWLDAPVDAAQVRGSTRHMWGGWHG
eukprot:366298-Chlamydomonas_euryale.AAC.12